MMLDLLASDDDNKLDKAHQVFLTIRKALLAQSVAPGTQLNIRSIAKIMKVSPTPVREALIRLADEEVVIVAARRGFYAKPMNLPELGMDIELVQMIAGFAIAHRLPSLSLQGIAEIALDTPAAQIATTIDALFQRMADATDNSRMQRMMDRALERSRRALDLDLERSDRATMIGDIVAALMSALRAGHAGDALVALNDYAATRAAALPEAVKEGNARAIESGAKTFPLLEG